jgi:hypothetical protein
MAGRGVFAAILPLAAALAVTGCGSPDPPPAPAGTHAEVPAATHAEVDVTPSRSRAPWTFAVSGDRPVVPNGSQDTHAATPEAACDSAELAKDVAIGQEITRAFTLAGFTASADLLKHFLAGQGTQVAYRPGSSVSAQALANSAFRAMNEHVQGVIWEQLKAGQTQVRLSASQLPAVAFESTTSDLYWGFRGTQGLTVAGSGTRADGRYSGTLTYVIRDSYGFPADDTLGGFGPPMRYLQTVCGAPQHAGGAHWFPDTITVTVPFEQPASGRRLARRRVPAREARG